MRILNGILSPESLIILLQSSLQLMKKSIDEISLFPIQNPIHTSLGVKLDIIYFRILLLGQFYW